MALRELEWKWSIWLTIESLVLRMLTWQWRSQISWKLRPVWIWRAGLNTINLSIYRLPIFDKNLGYFEILDFLRLEVSCWIVIMRVSDHQQQSYKTGVAVKKFYFALGGMRGSAYPTGPKQNSRYCCYTILRLRVAPICQPQNSASIHFFYLTPCGWFTLKGIEALMVRAVYGGSAISHNTCAEWEWVFLDRPQQ